MSDWILEQAASDLLKHDPKYQINTASDIIHWASQLERRYDIPFEERLELVNATFAFVERVKPIYLKYHKDTAKIC